MLDWVISFFIDAPLGQAIVKFLTNKIAIVFLVIVVLVGIVAFSGFA